MDPGFVVSSGEPNTFDILHENELVVAVIALLPPITLGENASHRLQEKNSVWMLRGPH